LDSQDRFSKRPLLRREETPLQPQRGIATRDGVAIAIQVTFDGGPYPDKLLPDGTIEHIGEGRTGKQVPRGQMARCSRQRAKIVESPSLRKSAPIFIARSVTTMFEAIDSSRWRRLQTPSGSGISSPSNPHPERHYIALPGSRQTFANVSSCASVLNPRSLKCVVKTTFAVPQLPTRYGPATCHFVSLKSAL